MEKIVYIAFDNDRVNWYWNGDPIEASGLLDYGRAMILRDTVED